MNEILEKAKELGIMIAESGEFEKLKIAEDRQLADPEAQKLMMEYATKRDELAQKAQAPDTTKEEFEAIKDEMQKEFEKMCKNENVKAYLDASNAFSNLINQVNSIIGYFVKGGDAGGCSGNCSSCGGCH
ncbi:MAG: YlbF family regulator [Clostridia bacterium]|nr:YlbF family regulator [Clostridia bacterium]